MKIALAIQALGIAGLSITADAAESTLSGREVRGHHVSATQPSVVSNAWQRLSGMLTPRFSCGGAALDHRIFVIGGYATTNRLTATVEVFDTRTRTWRRRAELPVALSRCGAVAVGETVYVVGGLDQSFHPVSAVWAYDATADRWLERKPIPKPTVAPGIVAVQGRVHVIGGVSLQGSRPKYESAMAIYDPAADAWGRASAMSNPRGYFAAAVCLGKIVVISGGPKASVPSVEAYDSLSGVWTTRADIPKGGHENAAAAIGDVIFNLCGASFHQYDLARDIWMDKSSPPRAVWGAVVAAVEEKLYLIGGSTGDAAGISDAVYAYDPAADP
jgi:N-acetylneuraminic acid mutarotase